MSARAQRFEPVLVNGAEGAEVAAVEAAADAAGGGVSEQNVGRDVAGDGAAEEGVEGLDQRGVDQPGLFLVAFA